MNASFTRTRSMLFVPATRPDLVTKIGRSGADVIVLDLEDTVPASAKEEARASVPALLELLAGATAATRLVRVNAPGTPWFVADMDSLAAEGVDAVVVPKIDGPSSVDEVDKLTERAGRGGLPVLAGIESALGVAAVEAVAARVGALYFGADDFAADMRGRRTAGNREVLYARSRTALAARVAGIPAFDHVFFDVVDEAGFRADAQEGRDLGYAGKMCLNPRQVAWANDVWTPTVQEMDWATRVLAAYDEVAIGGEGVAFVDGRVIDLPAVRLARHVLDQQPDQQGA